MVVDMSIIWIETFHQSGSEPIFKAEENKEHFLTSVNSFSGAYSENLQQTALIYGGF